jgi:TusA-related sulfurtransferase
MATLETYDFTDLTCTNLMIKLKILLKKLPVGEQLNFYSNREQYDNIKKPFAKDPYKLQGEQLGDNRYLVAILKNSKR